MKLNKHLLWALCLTLLATALALWLPDRTPAVPVTGELLQRSSAGSSVNLPINLTHPVNATSVTRSTPDVHSPEGVLPAQLRRPEFRVGLRELLSHGAPRPTPPAAPVQIEVPPQAPAVPPLPTLDYRFWGRMLTPDGGQLTLLARGEHVESVVPGQRLEGGFKVLAVERHLIRLSHPQLEAPIELVTPPSEGP
jgi:hypothetical protein